MGERDEKTEALWQQLREHLQGGQAVVVATASLSGEPHTALMTWVVAREDGTLAIAMDDRGSPFRNLKENPRVAIEVLLEDLVCLVRGKTRVFKERLAASPFPSSGVLVEIVEIRDHRAAGVEFHAPSYTFSEGKSHRYETEAAIFAELRS